MSRPPAKVYLALCLVTGAFVALLIAIVRGALWVPAGPVPPRSLIAPITALAALTGVVWLMMVVFRNLAVARGTASVGYYKRYATADAPPEWVERPARTFMNLLEAPVLFYVVCVLMIVTGDLDPVQLALAWLYVAARVAHAAIYLASNYVPMRLAAYVSSCAVLIVIWVRFAA